MIRKAFFTRRRVPV